MYAKILVPVDGSETSKHGLNEAIKLVKAQGGQLRLVHVVNELILVDQYEWSTYEGNVIEILRKGGRDILNEAESMVRERGLEPQGTLLEHVGGAAADLIVAQAKEWPADLIVMGTHGRRGIRRLALGSDAEQVVRLSPVPVLLVGDKAKRNA